MSADVWTPTSSLRWSSDGKLQQYWVREVREWRTYGGKERQTFRTESEWRDVPSESEKPR